MKVTRSRDILDREYHRARQSADVAYSRFRAGRGRAYLNLAWREYETHLANMIGWASR